MLRNWKFISPAICCLLSTAIVATAQEGSVLVEPQAASPGDGPMMAPPGPAVVEIMPTPTAQRETAIVVKPAPPIESQASRSARRMYRGNQQIELVMVTKNPVDCCFYEIPLCLPACCVGEPQVSEGRSLFGRGVVEYCWACGFTATVKFRPIRGDVKIRYDG